MEVSPSQAIRDAERRTGIPYATLWYRTRRKHLSLDEAIAWGKPSNVPRGLPGVAEAAERCEVSRAAILKRMRVNGCSVELAAELGKNYRGRKKRIVVVLDFGEVKDKRLARRR